MRHQDARWIAEACGAELVAATAAADEGPIRAVIDSRQAGPGDLFFGLSGASDDGGRFAVAAVESGCWGVVVSNRWKDPAIAAAADAAHKPVVLISSDPLASLQSLARNWRRLLGGSGTAVVGITGSVGKTSTKDIARALLPPPVHASAQNLNTEIGLPISLLEAESGVRSLVLEMAMRGKGQIAELMAIAEPDIGAITNVGPVHTELLGSVEAVAAAKAEMLETLPDGAHAVVPSEPGPLEPHLGRHGERLGLIRFGTGGDVEAGSVDASGGGISAEIRLTGTAAALASARDTATTARFDFPFDSSHNLTNALAAVAIGLAAGSSLEEMSRRAGDISFSRLRGERIRLGAGIEIVNDCYNANPVSMRAALTHLGETSGSGRRIAVLGLMAELGDESDRYHAEIGRYARESGRVDLLVGVGAESRQYDPDELVADPAEAAELLAEVASAGDTVLIKGSRSAGLEAVAENLTTLLEVSEEAPQSAPGDGGGHSEHG